MKISRFRTIVSRTGLLAMTTFIPVLEPDSVAASFDNSELKALYNTHQWLKLRDAVLDAPDAPPLYRGAVASAFNDSELGEQLLLRFLESAPSPEEALAAHNLLADLYWRTGRFRLALPHVEQSVALGDNENDLVLMRTLAQMPEMSITRHDVSALHVWHKNAFVTASINGKSYKCYLDTGANISVISESASKRLGLTLFDVSGVKLSGAAATERAVKQIAMADQLSLGRIQLEHVPFVVVQDSAQPFAGWSSGKRCILGLQVLLACRSVCWKGSFPGAALVLGAPPAPRDIHHANLFFDHTMPHVAAGFRQSTLDLLLDTGSGWSWLGPRFAEEFPEVVRGSEKKNVRSLQGLDGTAKVETISSHHVKLRLGDLDTTFRRMEVQLRAAGMPRHHGTLGQDLLKKAREVTFDFEAMRLTLR